MPVEFSIGVIFFASGAAALIFEVVWFHRAGLVFGNDLWSTSLVLSTYMGGLALGNGLVVAYGHRIRKPLRTYAFIEAAVAFTGLAVTYVLPQLTRVLVPLLQHLTIHPHVSNGARSLVAFAVLMVPTTGLGATLPVLVAALCRQQARFGYVLGRLYGWNTLGAVAGVVATEMILVPRLGVAGTAWFAALLDIGGAFAVWMISQRTEEIGPSQRGDQETRRVPLTVTVSSVLTLAFLSGVALMALEVIWFRFLSMFALNTTLTFSLMLAVVLGAIGSGGLAASAWLRRRPHAVVYLPALAFGAATASVASYVMFDSLTGIASAVQWYRVLWIAFSLTCATSFLSGLIFTFLGQVLRGSTALETSAAAWLTLVNTSGAMCGSLAATFILLPVLGIERAIFVVAALYFVLGLIALWLPLGWSTVARPVSGLAMITAVVMLTRFPFGLMTSEYVVRAASKYTTDGSRIVATREGPSETIFLLEQRWLGTPLYHRLVTNGFSMASTRLTDQRYMRYFVYWPMLMHGSPIRRVLVVCYGAGVTLGAVTELKSVESIDVVEISPDIVRMSDRIYPDQSPLGDSRVQLHIADGRQFLLTTDRQFDLITGEPPPPLTPGAVNLYTREYFQLMHDRLAEGGIATYWLPVADGAVHSVSPIIRAFCDVFEDCSLWSGTLFDWVLIGTRHAQGPASDAAFTRAWSDPTLGAHLRELLFELPQQFGATFIGDAAYLKSLTAATPALTDNFPRRVLPASAAPLFGDATNAEAMKAFVSALDPARARAAFQQSPFIQRLWPPTLLEETLPLFDQRPLINAVMATAVSPLRYIAELDDLLTRTQLRMLPLWILGSNRTLQEVADGGNDETGLVEYQLGARLLIARSYRGAANYFEAAERLGLRSAWLRPLRIYALCLAGEVEAAEQLTPTFGEADQDARPFWNWMEARFGLRLGRRSSGPAH